MSAAQGWNDGQINPTAAGRYLRKYPQSLWSKEAIRPSYWDGRLWHRAEVMQDGAPKTPPHRLASAFQSLPWSAA